MMKKAAFRPEMALDGGPLRGAFLRANPAARGAYEVGPTGSVPYS